MQPSIFMKNEGESQKPPKSESNTDPILEERLAVYNGLQVKEATTLLKVDRSKTVLIARWERPKWAGEPYIKLDYPQMGCLIYERPSKRNAKVQIQPGTHARR